MGLDFKDGYQTLTTFALDANFKFWEKTNKPIGVSSGGAIDTTTQHNTTVRTKHPKALIDITDSTMNGAWAHATYAEVMAMVGKNQQITTTFPDGSTTVWWGWIDAFEPDDMEEGEHPTASLTLMASNQDDACVEQVPVHTTV